MNKYKIRFLGDKEPDEEVEASKVFDTNDGQVSWLVFSDGLGEVRRVRSALVERIDRMG